MKKKRDYQEPWTLQLSMTQALGLMQTSMTFAKPSSSSEETVNVDKWEVDGAAKVNQSLDDWQ
jgi:hypothetical protein